ncbi:E3 ubiquitin-protein ligase listerin [Dunckerocampus dactyliophorus]|uniref:E3 ubiquitin-protein ligase listerin n=1 Tax=Dunckerocampus dactyliophorus TaxID=161453 RepID=UPI0024072F81|nr:E3 ubiquitin-protein ligase listerin [Dunckerocampus dactyliophorus]
MGGKNKQRTKGNVRPSSSGRAAEVLTREGGAIPGFVGFDTTLTSELSYVPALHGAEEIDNLVDADFRLVLRKLSKRDVVTRLKAVQDFGSMCQERDAEDVKGVLPYWPRIYCKISVDHDRRIREATQLALEQLVLKVRRSLAPFLKSLMGHWILSQCDTYTPAASAARRAFQAAFSTAKQPEALSFCRDEILNVLQDVLLKDTADTLSDPQSVTEEEREAKYMRMLTSSLLGVKRLLSLLPQNDMMAMEQRLALLMSPAKFWKYSRHKAPQVRGAFFEMLCAVCELTPELAQAEAARLCPAVLLSIDDTDPLVLPAVWEAVLHVVSRLPECWTHVNAKKGFLPKLWALLKEGGKGMAKALHPNLMPFLSKLPQQVTNPALDFYTTFFTSLILGISSERAASSPSESAVIVTSIVECLRFCIIRHAAEDEESHQRKICSMLISQQLLPLLEMALENPTLQNGPLFLLVTEMLVSWEKRAGPESKDSKDVFHGLVADFWEELGLVFIRHADNGEANPQALEGISALLQVMRYPGRVNRRHAQKKKSVKICLSESGDEDGDGVEVKQTELVAATACSSPQTCHFEKVVRQLVQLCLVHVNERCSERHLVFLSLLLQSFHTSNIFTTLVELDDKGEGTVSNPAVRFLLERVVPWLADKERMETEHLVEMVFSSLTCCSQQETTRILNHITTMGLHCGITLQIIQRACVDHDTLASCRDWLKGSVLGEHLLGLTQEICKVRPSRSGSASPTNRPSWTLISLVLSQHHNNEPLIGEVYMEKILEKLHATLSETKSLSDAGNMEPLVSFICDVASTFFSSVQDCLLLPSAEDLLLTVFQLISQDQTHTYLSDSLLDKMGKVCVAGIKSLVQNSEYEVKEGGFLHSAALWVKSRLLTVSLDVKSLQYVVMAVQSVVETITSVCDQDSTVLTQFFTHLMPSVTGWTKLRQALPSYWVKTPLLTSRYRGVCDTPSVDMWKLKMSDILPGHLCACALLGKVARTTTLSYSKNNKCQPHLPHLIHTVAELLYALQWCKEVEYTPAIVSTYHSLLTEWGLSEGLQGLFATGDLLETLYSRCVELGGLWSLTLENYIHPNNLAYTLSASLSKLYSPVDSLLPVTQSKLSTLQVLCPTLSQEDRETLVTLATAGIINWEEDDDVYGCVAVLLCCLQADTQVEEEVVQAVLATMMEWRNRKEDWFLFGSDLSKATTQQLNLTLELMRFLSWLVKHWPTVLNSSQWDFLLCAMLAWLETVSENVSSLWNPWVQLFACESASLVVKLSQFFASSPPDVLEKLPAELEGEWRDFFLDGIYNLLLPMPVKITEAFKEPDDPIFPLAVLQSLGVVLSHVPPQQLNQNNLPAKFIADQKTNLPQPLQTLLNTFCPLLLFKARPLQVTVYHLLAKVMPQLPECDGEGDGNKSEDEGDETSLSPPAALMAVLSTCEELCDSILAGLQVGEFALVSPHSVEFSCILGYLLAWKLLLTFFKSSPSHLRAHYAQYLKKTCSLNKLLLHLFKLMPENPIYLGQGPEPRDSKTFFTESLTLAVDKRDNIEWELPHLACSVYYSTVQDLPAMVRLWWNSQEKRVSGAVEKFTTKHVSPVLSAAEISSVHGSMQMFDSMTVKARSAAREVIATYSVDDIFIELVIQLPQNYPLGSIVVESGRRVGVSVQQWRNWMLQLSTYLTHQNGSIMEGLALWKNNVDKRFEGIEDCMICFSVIHGSNYSLPKKACRTCKKKFHSACLYKWFTSSNKSTCPLCRETFF